MKSEQEHRKALVQAFLQGAKWWEYKQSLGFTMWQSDQEAAVEEAKRKLRNGTLGETRND
jgi:hypothetical protein